MAASQTIRTLKLSLLADVSEFGKGLDKAGNSFTNFSKTVDRAAGVAAGVVGVIGGLAASAINAASDLEETRTALDDVFGDEASQQLQDFARTADRSLGQSRQEALSAAQTFGIFGSAAGLADDDLVDFTTTLIKLAGDLASFQNTTPEQAITALGAALRGESEPIRNYGVLLDAATVKQRALAEGLIETEQDALSPATRTLAIYAEVLNQTQTQQGNFAQTAAGFANTQRTFASQMENFKADIGEVLLPIVQDLLPELRGIVDTFADSDPEKVVELGISITQLAGAVIALNGALKAFAAVQGAARFLFSTAGTFLVALASGGSSNIDPTSEGFYLDGGYSPEEARRLAAQARGEATGTLNPIVRTGNRGRSATTGGLRTRASEPIIVNGVIGSTYQVYRELERTRAAGNRAGIRSDVRFDGR